MKLKKIAQIFTSLLALVVNSHADDPTVTFRHSISGRGEIRLVRKSEVHNIVTGVVGADNTQLTPTKVSVTSVQYEDEDGKSAEIEVGSQSVDNEALSSEIRLLDIKLINSKIVVLVLWNSIPKLIVFTKVSDVIARILTDLPTEHELSFSIHQGLVTQSAAEANAADVLFKGISAKKTIKVSLVSGLVIPE